jgi:hypothetical protein
VRLVNASPGLSKCCYIFDLYACLRVDCLSLLSISGYLLLVDSLEKLFLYDMHTAIL